MYRVCVCVPYKDNNVQERYTKLTIGTFWSGKAKKFPCLRGRAIWVRNLIDALLHVFESLHDPENPQHRQVMLALMCTASIEEILKRHDGKNRVPDADADRLVTNARDFFGLNTALGFFFHPRHIALFNSTIKFHYLLHVMNSSRRLHPNKVWCYGGESYLKHVRRMVARISFGCKLENVSNNVVTTYANALHMALRDDGNIELS